MMLHCPECGETVRGRTDKKFCSAYCRTSFHNKKNSDSINYMRNVNNLLRKNRRILLKHNPGGKTKIRKSQLLKNGFNFNYFTNQYVTMKGKTYRFCYEQGYLDLENGYLALVQRNDYVE
ncbi:MAG: hypothetical protein HKO89_08240 [Saprospiraceae bacterium]|nr:hypothetical protein [Bacteroidia bacterium]NNK90579.1 hypothetical protein [Saprospiraceae bacterium]